MQTSFLGRALLGLPAPTHLPRVILISGTDGVGKSTFAREIAVQLNAKIMHFGPPTHGSWMEEYLTPVLDHLHDNPGEHLVLDRGFTEDRAWSQVFGRPSLYRDRGDFIRAVKLHQRMIPSLGVLFIARQLDAIRDTLQARGESFGQFRQSALGQTFLAEEYLRIDHLLPVNRVRSDTLWRLMQTSQRAQQEEMA